MGSGPIKISVSDHHYIRNIFAATGTPTPLTLCPGVPGYCMIRNTNESGQPIYSVFLSASADSTVPLISLKPGEWAVFRISPDAIPHIQINPALVGRRATAGPIEFTQGIESIPVLNGGTSYTTAPAVEIEGDGTGAVAHATVGVGGAVTGVVIDSPGTGYTTATASFVGVGTGATAGLVSFASFIKSIPVLNGGALYTTAPTVTIEGNGTGAIAHATIVRGVVTQVVVNTPGVDYTTATAIFSDPPVAPGIDVEYSVIAD